MRKFATIALTFALNAQAGSLTDGRWSASGCGDPPKAPAISTESVDAYNRSLKTLRDWQEKAQAHNNCVVKEANADNQAIAAAANGEQQRFRDAIAEVQAAAEAGKAKLDRR